MPILHNALEGTKRRFLRSLPPFLAGAGAALLLSGCFFTVTPERPCGELPAAVRGDASWFQVTPGDNLSCLRVFLPPDSFRRPVPAAVIFPGGAYAVLALEKEGCAYASFLNRRGIAGIVVRYPLGSIFGHFSRHPAMVDTARRAVQLTRYYAPQLGIDPRRVGVMGSSAGGHLAGLCIVCKDAADPRGKDPVTRCSSRPDFAVLCYPVVTMTGKYAHRRSRDNLLGSDPAPELLKQLSLEQSLPDDAPPVFLWTTREDATVDPENTRLLDAALTRKKIPHRTVIYEKGPHGMGLLSPSQAEKYPETAKWPQEMIEFLRHRKILGDR
ncbi:MAG: alpha/beta hydrolase [Lentisphaeria bacterium]|nr:alpha/beta hydrolase [Lentisphaeria bacterium]